MKKQVYTLFALLIFYANVFAINETIKTGSLIINMGNTNLASANDDIRPYALIYDLIKNYGVPVKWVIGQSKIKDGIDFVHNGVSYKGGTFIIPKEYRSTAVDARITYWISQGVVSNNSIADMVLDVTHTITSVPRWTLDATNGGIAQSYLTAAGITLANFPGAYNWKLPAALDCCDDFYVMPHADPIWSTHSNLFFWNQNCKGSIWAACHAVSSLENAINPTNSTQQMNFLSTRSTVTTPAPWPNNSTMMWGTHSGGSVPYTHQLPTDPVAQYMGVTDLSQLNGSEQIYIPKQPSHAPNGPTRWRPTTKIIVYDPSQVNVPTPDVLNGNVAAAIVYGRAFGNNNNGWVMYEAGHSHLKGTASDGAALRAFFNFSFFQALDKVPQVSPSGITGITSGGVYQGGANLSFNVSATPGLPTSTISTYEWKISLNGGTFTSAGFTPATGSNSTTYSMPAVLVTTSAIVQVKIIDNCGRTTFAAIPFTITAPPSPPVANNDVANISSACSPGTAVTLNVLNNDSDPQSSPITFTSLILPGSPANAGAWTSDASGNVTFTPDPNFSGAATVNYYITSSLGMRDTATIAVNVGTIDAFGCTSNQVWGIESSDLLTVENVSAFGGTITAAITPGSVTDPRLDAIENLWSSSSNTTGNFIDLGTNIANYLDFTLPSSLNIGDTIVVNWGKRTNSGTTVLALYQSTSATFSGTATTISITGAGNMPQTTRYGITTNNTTHIRVRVHTGTGQQLYLDAIRYEDWNCVSRKPQLSNDNVTLLEDAPTILNVMANDDDPQNLPITIKQITSSPTRGKVSINPDGTITYVSNRDINGTDAFTYEACNTQGYCNTATVNVTVIADGCGTGQYKANPPAGAVTKIFKYQYTGTNAATQNANTVRFTDSYIEQDDILRNRGTDAKLEIGYLFSGVKSSRTLTYFNISEIPTNAIVQSAVFSLKRVGGDNVVQTGLLYRDTASWTETGVTWTRRNATPTLWQTAGGDYSSTLIDSAVIGTSNVYYNWNIPTLAQSWIVDSTKNFGVLLKTKELLAKRIQFGSKNDGDIPDRPQLTITYVIPVPCAAIPNRAPLSNPDYVTVLNGQSVVINPLTNDADVDLSSSFTVTGVTNITAGSATFTSTSINYTANTTSIVPRTERLSYIITDNNGANDTAYVYILVTNAPPLANRDNAITNSDSAITINVTSNDVDPEGGTLTAPTIYLAPKYGTAIVSGNNIIYTPGAGFTGKDTLIYELCEVAAGSCSPQVFCDTALVVITVNNRAPVANNDPVSFRACQSKTINIISNDTDPENGVLTVNIVTTTNPVTQGTLVNNNDGTVTFTPITGAPSPITFTYTITDNGVSPLTSAIATVTLTIISTANAAPIALNDTADTQYMGEVIYISILDNDSDPDDNILSLPVITVNPSHGSAFIMPNGLVQYTSNPGYYGTDTLVYRICDTVSNPLTCAKSQGLCDPATVYISIIPPSNTTVAYNDEHSTWIDVNVSGNILTNDYDPGGEVQTFRGFYDQATSSYITSGSITAYASDGITPAGTLTIFPNGDFTFDPLPSFTGVVSIPYNIEDNVVDGNRSNATATAFLKITINNLVTVSNSVIANNDEFVAQLNQTVNSSVLSNDADPQGNTTSVSVFTFDSDGNGTQDSTGTIGSTITIGGISTTGIPTNNAGTLVLNANGTYTFNPQDDFTGSIDVVYNLCDNYSPAACQQATLHIDVLPDINGASNDSPFGGDDFKYTNINTPTTGNALLNDLDPNVGNTISATPQTTTIPGVGTLVMLANGSYTFTPALGYTGPANFTYTVCDNQSPAKCSNATIHFLVGISNSTVAINDENNTWLDVNVLGNVVTNDYDLENNLQNFGNFIAQDFSTNLTTGSTVGGVSKSGTPVANAGSLSFDAFGNYTFDPSPTFTGTVSIPYSICDNGNTNKCDTAYLTITVDSIPSSTVNNVIANNDENISYGSSVGGNLLINDRDPQFNSFSVTSFVGGTIGVSNTISGVDLNGNTIANAGTLTINANGTYLYVPLNGFVGNINVPYTITDSLGATSLATLKIEVASDPNGNANNPPFAGDDHSFTSINQPISASFIANDNDPNGNPLTMFGTTINTAGPRIAIGSAQTTNAGGTIQFYSDGTYTYTPPTNYVGPDYTNYTICDSTIIMPQPLCRSAQISLLVGPGVDISGTVWVDANGNVSINAPEAGTNASNSIYVNLINNLGNVIAVAIVDTNGAYEFKDVAPGYSYSLVLTNTPGTIGAPAPSPSLPSGWVNTGESTNGSLEGGVLGNINIQQLRYANNSTYNFGIEQLPNSIPANHFVSQPTLGQVYTLDGGSNPPILSGNDPEDGSLGINNTLKITTIPTNAVLKYNGIAVTTGQIISNFDPSLLQIEITSATLGFNNVEFEFVFIDEANKEDISPAVYKLFWTNPLPVELVSFVGKASQCEVILNWTTAAEINSDKYEIETSIDGINFSKIGVLKSENSTSGASYQATVSQNNGTSYYRLKMIDFDNSYKYSPIISVASNCNLIEKMVIYPNPTIQDVNIDFITNYRGVATIKALSSIGSIAISKEINIETQSNFVKINMGNLTSGLYSIIIYDNNGNVIGETKKIIKE